MMVDMMKECACPKPVGACPRRGDCVACTAFHENHPRPSACMRPEIGPKSLEAARHMLLVTRDVDYRLTKRTDLPPDDQRKR